MDPKGANPSAGVRGIPMQIGVAVHVLLFTDALMQRVYETAAI
jgi:hypothetical protein